MIEQAQLIDSIYEAAVVSELWPTVLDNLAKATESAWGAIVAIRAGMMSSEQTLFVGTPRAQESFAYYLSIGAPFPNKRVAYPGAERMHEFITDFDMFTPEEIEKDPWYTQLMRPFGGGWFAGTGIASLTGDLVALNVERAHALGPYPRQIVDLLNGLRPHIARAGLLSARLSLEKAKSETDALERVGLAAAVLDGRGRVRAVNPRMTAMMPNVLLDRRDRVTLADRSADKLLLDALARLPFGDQVPGVRSIALAAREEHPALIAHLIPIRRSASDIFALAGSMLVITESSPSGGPDAQILQGLFDLSPAEARVARGIAQGLEVNDIAKEHGISRETVRTHLKRIFGKTGTKRQADLGFFLNGFIIPPA